MRLDKSFMIPEGKLGRSSSRELDPDQSREESKQMEMKTCANDNKQLKTTKDEDEAIYVM